MKSVFKISHIIPIKAKVAIKSFSKSNQRKILWLHRKKCYKKKARVNLRFGLDQRRENYGPGAKWSPLRPLIWPSKHHHPKSTLCFHWHNGKKNTAAFLLPFKMFLSDFCPLENCTSLQCLKLQLYRPSRQVVALAFKSLPIPGLHKSEISSYLHWSPN